MHQRSIEVLIKFTGKCIWGCMIRMTQAINPGRLALAGSSGLLITGSFPVIGLDFLAWVALVPLLIALRDLSAFDGFRIGFFCGLVHYFSLLYWFVPFLATYGPFPVILSTGILLLFCAYLSLYLGMFGLILTWIRIPVFSLLMIIPAIWVGLEYLRAILLSGFPWELLGHTQFNKLHIIQISDIVGVYGVSFLIALANGLAFVLYHFITRKSWCGQKIVRKHVVIYASFFGILFIVVWTYGQWQIGNVSNKISQVPSKKIAVVQGNVDQTVKWDRAYQLKTINKYIDLSRQASAQNPELIVWPETSMPFYFGSQMPQTRLVLKNLESIGVDTLLGSPAYAKDADRVAYYNRVFLVDSNGTISDAYNKSHLVPFGEYVPFKRWLPFLGKMVQHVGDFSTGTVGDTLVWGQLQIGALICYEMIFPYLARAATQNGAQLLINVTNDAWYGRTSAPYQHFSMAVFRAVETRRALVRSANTGISGFIDPLGRILSQTALFEEAVLVADVPVMAGQTLYVKRGDFFALACTMAGAILILIEFIQRIQANRKLPRGGTRNVTRN